jgi:5'-deoxynucleotidase YfbR-like HD superfamily hydrolase
MEKLRLIDKWNEEYSRFVKHKAKLEMLLNKSRGISSGAGVDGVKKRIEREITANEKQEYKSLKIKVIIHLIFFSIWPFNLLGFN